jgi:serine protease
MKGTDYTNTIAKNLGKIATLHTLNGYAAKDGTSMATPHVTGAIAAIWRGCPKCNNTQVVNCLTSTAYDLGPEGRDDEYGHGLIQTKNAYDCLLETCCSKPPGNFTNVTNFQN